MFQLPFQKYMYCEHDLKSLYIPNMNISAPTISVAHEIMVLIT